MSRDTRTGSPCGIQSSDTTLARCKAEEEIRTENSRRWITKTGLGIILKILLICGQFSPEYVSWNECDPFSI